VFVTHRRPGPGKAAGPRDACPDTGPARLTYGRARALLDAHTALRGPGTGWDLHEYRHSGLTHLREAGASVTAARRVVVRRNRNETAKTACTIKQLQIVSFILKTLADWGRSLADCRICRWRDRRAQECP
jgi:hypothetical protein